MTVNLRSWLPLAPVLVFGLWSTAGHATPITDFFSLRNGTATTLSGTGNTDDPVLGTLSTTGSAARLMGYFPEQTLTNVGDAIMLSFTVEFADNMASMGNGSDNFRYALYDRNGETPEPTNSNIAANGTTNTDAFRGYWYGVDTNTGTSGAQGTIRERSGTTGDTDPFANASAANIGAPGGSEVMFALGETYTGSMTLTLTGLNEITLTGSFSGTNGGNNTFSLVDSSPVTKSYSVVGFLNGGGLSADQASFHDFDVTYKPIPEPATWALGILSLTGGMLLRRRL
jgi:hypothetical protein